VFYLLQTWQSVAFCSNVDELYSALSYRPIASATLHSSDNFEPLRHVAGISQHRFIECNADDKNPIAQISLPSTVSETVCLKTPVLDDSVALNLMPLVQTGKWAISALNGFYTAPSDIELCKLLAGGALAYPMAQWLESSPETAVIAARQNYVKRFYSRFWYSAEQTFLPQCWLDCFQDRYFAEREGDYRGINFEVAGGNRVSPVAFHSTSGKKIFRNVRGRCRPRRIGLAKRSALNKISKADAQRNCRVDTR